jgi:NAD(P)-dependent dehydrogenase (short-subunit alcohol dehydrogenase family)
MFMKPNRVVLITGAAGNIGMSLSLKFSRLGYFIVALDIQDSVMSTLSDDLGLSDNSFLALKIDVTIYNEVEKAVCLILKKVGKVDVLINNAGGPFSDSLTNTNVSQWLADIDLNLHAAYYLTSAILPSMLKKKNGCIINMSSVNGLSIYGHPGYSVAKAGLIHYSKFVAMEYGKYGIRTNVICPGTVKTNAWNQRLKKNPKLLDELKKLYSTQNIVTADDVASLAIFLASSEAKNINGATMVVDGGLTSGIEFIANMFTQHDLEEKI